MRGLTERLSGLRPPRRLPGVAAGDRGPRPYLANPLVPGAQWRESQDAAHALVFGSGPGCRMLGHWLSVVGTFGKGTTLPPDGPRLHRAAAAQPNPAQGPAVRGSAICRRPGPVGHPDLRSGPEARVVPRPSPREDDPGGAGLGSGGELGGPPPPPLLSRDLRRDLQPRIRAPVAPPEWEMVFAGVLRHRDRCPHRSVHRERFLSSRRRLMGADGRSRKVPSTDAFARAPEPLRTVADGR